MDITDRFTYCQVSCYGDAPCSCEEEANIALASCLTGTDTSGCQGTYDSAISSCESDRSTADAACHDDTCADGCNSEKTDCMDSANSDNSDCYAAIDTTDPCDNSCADDINNAANDCKTACGVTRDDANAANLPSPSGEEYDRSLAAAVDACAEACADCSSNVGCCECNNGCSYPDPPTVDATIAASIQEDYMTCMTGCGPDFDALDACGDEKWYCDADFNNGVSAAQSSCNYTFSVAATTCDYDNLDCVNDSCTTPDTNCIASNCGSADSNCKADCTIAQATQLLLDDRTNSTAKVDCDYAGTLSLRSCLEDKNVCYHVADMEMAPLARAILLTRDNAYNAAALEYNGTAAAGWSADGQITPPAYNPDNCGAGCHDVYNAGMATLCTCEFCIWGSGYMEYSPNACNDGPPEDYVTCLSGYFADYSAAAAVYYYALMDCYTACRIPYTEAITAAYQEYCNAYVVLQATHDASCAECDRTYDACANSANEDNYTCKEYANEALTTATNAGAVNKTDCLNTCDHDLHAAINPTSLGYCSGYGDCVNSVNEAYMNAESACQTTKAYCNMSAWITNDLCRFTATNSYHETYSSCYADWIACQTEAACNGTDVDPSCLATFTSCSAAAGETESAEYASCASDYADATTACSTTYDECIAAAVSPREEGYTTCISSYKVCADPTADPQPTFGCSLFNIYQ